MLGVGLLDLGWIVVPHASPTHEHPAMRTHVFRTLLVAVAHFASTEQDGEQLCLCVGGDRIE